MTIDHHCKFCSATVVLEIEDSALEMMDPEHWKAMAACNKCADFLEKKHRIIDRIIKSVVLWIRHKTKQVSLTKEDEENLRVGISEGIRKFADHICEFYRIEFVLEHDFPTQVMERPGKCWKILRSYENRIARRSHKKPVIAGKHYEE